MQNVILEKPYGDTNILVESLGLNSYLCSYKHVKTTYIAFSILDAYDIFIEAINDKRSIVFQLLKGGDAR
jgi:hypothetical protein